MVRDPRHEMSVDGSSHPKHSQRNAQRSLGTAEGILVALGQCVLADAFAEIVTTAKRGNVAAIELADALIAIVEGAQTDSMRPEVITAAQNAWGTLLPRTEDRREAAAAPVTLVDAIPDADEADLVEQARYPGADGWFGGSDDSLVGDHEADPADLIEQRTPVVDDEDTPDVYD